VTKEGEERGSTKEEQSIFRGNVELPRERAPTSKVLGGIGKSLINRKEKRQGAGEEEPDSLGKKKVVTITSEGF